MLERERRRRKYPRSRDRWDESFFVPSGRRAGKEERGPAGAGGRTGGTVLTEFAEDPRGVLGVAAEAGEEEIRAAYLRKIKEYPPERAPAEFERVRDAYELLRDPRRRVDHLLFRGEPMAPLQCLLDSRRAARRFIGPEALAGGAEGEMNHCSIVKPSCGGSRPAWTRPLPAKIRRAAFRKRFCPAL